MLGLSADDIAKLKQGDDQVPYESVLKRAMWSEWLLRIQSRTQCVLQSILLFLYLRACCMCAHSVICTCMVVCKVVQPRDWAP